MALFGYGCGANLAFHDSTNGVNLNFIVYTMGGGGVNLFAFISLMGVSENLKGNTS